MNISIRIVNQDAGGVITVQVVHNRRLSMSFTGHIVLPLMVLCSLCSSLAAAETESQLADGVIHYWKFDAVKDTGISPPQCFPDAAGVMPLFITRKPGEEWLTAGVAGSAVDIANGVYVDNQDGAESDLSTGNLTVAGWIKLKAPTSTTIMSAGNHFSPLNKPWALSQANGRLAFYGGAKSVLSPEPLPEGRWAHVAAVVSTADVSKDGTERTVRLFIDGKEVASGGVNVAKMPAQVIVGNSHRGGPGYFCGQIDELAIWERALSAAEITALWRLGEQGKALSSVVTAQPVVAIRAVKASDGSIGGAFILSRDNDRGALRVMLGYSGLAIPNIDYASLARIQVIPDGAREIRFTTQRLEGSTPICRDDLKATIEPNIHYAVSETEASARVWLARDWPSLPDRPKKIFAHYMGCYPAGAGATAYHRGYDAHKVRHTDKGRIESGGGRFRNWPLVPDGMRVSLEESADLEIRRAIRGGIDGFAVDAWAGGQNSKDMFSALLKVARDKNYPFEITVCLDPGVLGLDGMQESVRWIMREHGQNPKLARRDGKPLIFGYLSSYIGLQHGAQALKAKPEFADKDIKDLRNNPDLRTTKAGWMLMAGGHREIEKAAGVPIFFHYCMWSFCGNNSANTLQAAGFMAGQFGAVGAFKGDGPTYDTMAEVVRAAGAEWSQPMLYQYENLFWQGNDEIAQGSNLLRRHWESARRNQSTLIQFVTWNDYTENTQLAPAYETRYAVLDLNRYFVDWWKAGAEPKPEKDKIYLFSQKYPVNAKMFPFKRVASDPSSAIEVLTILTEPATVRLVGRGDAWEAPAGMSWKQFPVTPGEVKAELIRGGKVVLSLESPDPITDRPCEQMRSMMAISTEDARHWREDFGDVPPAPVFRGLYADDDKDGLPNWFEMYWFGKWKDWSTATKADPKAIGAGGKTMLQHYLDQTDPVSEGSAEPEMPAPPRPR